MIYSRGPQPPGCGLALVGGLLGMVAQQEVSSRGVIKASLALQLELCLLSLHATIVLGKMFLSTNRSLVPKRLGTAAP